MKKTFVNYILAVVTAIALIRICPSTVALAQKPLQRPPSEIAVQQPPTTFDLMNAITSLSAQVTQLKQTVDSQAQTISQLQKVSLVEAQSVHDIAGRLGVTCGMVDSLYWKVVIPPALQNVQNLPYCMATGSWDAPTLQRFTQPFYR